MTTGVNDGTQGGTAAGGNPTDQGEVDFLLHVLIEIERRIGDLKATSNSTELPETAGRARSMDSGVASP